MSEASLCVICLEAVFVDWLALNRKCGRMRKYAPCGNFFFKITSNRKFGVRVSLHIFVKTASRNRAARAGARLANNTAGLPEAYISEQMCLCLYVLLLRREIARRGRCRRAPFEQTAQDHLSRNFRVDGSPCVRFALASRIH